MSRMLRGWTAVRSAITGRWVRRSEAEKHPAETVVERMTAHHGGKQMTTTLAKITTEPVPQGAPIQVSVSGLPNKPSTLRATQFGFIDPVDGDWVTFLQEHISDGTLTIDSPDNLVLDPRYGYDYETNPAHARPFVQVYISDGKGNVLAPFVEFTLGPAA